MFCSRSRRGDFYRGPHPNGKRDRSRTSQTRTSRTSSVFFCTWDSTFTRYCGNSTRFHGQLAVLIGDLVGSDLVGSGSVDSDHIHGSRGSLLFVIPHHIAISFTFFGLCEAIGGEEGTWYIQTTSCGGACRLLPTLAHDPPPKNPAAFVANGCDSSRVTLSSKPTSWYKAVL